MKMKYLTTDGEFAELIWKTPYNHDTNAESDRTGLKCEDKSLTQQQFKEDADINNIIERFKASGTPPPIALPEHFLDLTETPTYFEIQTRLAEANATFYKLDAPIRAQFLNNPARWADAVVQAANANDTKTLAELGLPTPPQAEEPGTPPAGTPAAGPQEGAPGAPNNAPEGA